MILVFLMNKLSWKLNSIRIFIKIEKVLRNKEKCDEKVKVLLMDEEL